jgi:hypothetical protein
VELIFDNNKINVSKATIYNALGAVVAEKSISANDYNSIKFDVSSLPSGIYFAKIENGNFSSTRKFVVN